MKLSKQRWRFASSLKGLSLKQYTAVQRFRAATVISRAAKYVDRGIWIKFDRQKPMGDDQIFQIRCALNKALLELVANYPFEIPFFKLRESPVTGFQFKKICVPVAFDLITLPHVGTEWGTAYEICKSPYTMNGFSGPIMFSGHAILRLLERIPALKKIAMEEWAPAPLLFLEKATKEPVVDPNTTMLQLDEFGHFPMKYAADKRLWVCTTFLEREMKGTPENRLRGGLEL